MTSRPKLDDPPAVRAARLDDDEALANFRCSSGRWFQREVEDFINTDLVARIASEEARALVFHVEQELVAVAAHQQETLVIAEEPGEVQATRLLVLAITERLHTATLADGTRLSDHLMETLLRDALSVHRTNVASAIVAIENQRSLAMCERNGLTSQTTIDATYARATGRFDM